MNDSESPRDELLTPAQRLEATRARLRKSWLREESAEQLAQRAAEDDSLIHRFTDLVANGWKHHPLKASIDAASSMAGPMLHSVLGPAARTHPLRLLALAGGLGVVIMWIKPWRLLSRAAVSSVLISAVIPRAAIARWWTSGQWLELLQHEGLQSWFATKSAPPGASSSRDGEPDDLPGAAASASDRATSAGAPASYANRAPSPIPATSTAP